MLGREPLLPRADWRDPCTAGSIESISARPAARTAARNWMSASARLALDLEIMLIRLFHRMAIIAQAGGRVCGGCLPEGRRAIYGCVP